MHAIFNVVYICCFLLLSGITIASEKTSENTLTNHSAQQRTQVEYLAQKGEPNAELQQGKLLLRKGYPYYSEGFMLVARAAEKGSPEAQMMVGDLYYNGQGVKQDIHKAVWWYQQASQQGYSNAYYKLGDLYTKGRGVDQNLVDAFQCYKLAAEKNHVDAQIRTAVLYGRGVGVDKNLTQSMRWYQRAAINGHLKAQYKLGTALSKEIVPDLPQAYAWLELAAEKGSYLSKLYKTRLKKKLTPQQISSGRERVRALIKQG